MLQLKTDLLGSVFGQERAATLLDQVTSSVRDRDLLHNSLLQRKSKLQVSISSFALEPGRGLRVAPMARDVCLCFLQSQVLDYRQDITLTWPL